VSIAPARSRATCPAASRRPQSLYQVLIEQLQIAYHLAAVSGLDREAFRSGILLKTERRIPPGAGEDSRREQGQPTLGPFL